MEHSLLLFPPLLMGLYHRYSRHQAGSVLVGLHPLLHTPPQTGAGDFWIRAIPETSIWDNQELIFSHKTQEKITRFLFKYHI
jgi:hypothetical protein